MRRETDEARPIGVLTGVERSYPWGSRTAIPALLGRHDPPVEPVAEVWFGAHPKAPALLRRWGHDQPLDAVVASDPAAELGVEVAQRFGGRLPFMVKLLAADHPLSLQVHPDAARAASGFADEQARGVPLDAPERSFPDDWPKPELLHPLTRFDALCGFRPVAATRELIDRLDLPELGAIRDRLGSDGPAGYLYALDVLLNATEKQRARTNERLVEAIRRVVATDTPFGSSLHAVGDLASRYPADPGVVVALLLDHYRLRPGETLIIRPGVIHAYLRGTAVEVMAASDNVLRGGLTSKHVDVAGLLEICDPAERAALVEPRPGYARDGHVSSYPTGVDAFSFHRVDLDGGSVEPEGTGPEILLCVNGTVEVETAGHRVPLRVGQAAFVPAGGQRIRLAGSGAIARTTVGETSGV